MREWMRQLGLLLRIQACRFCGINALMHGHDKRQRRRALGTLGISLLIAAMAAGYSAMVALMLKELGAADAIPRLFALAAAVIAFFVVMMKGPELIFGGHDVPTLRSLPVTTGAIVVSRLTGVLLPEVGVALLMGIPAGIVMRLSGCAPGQGAAFVLALCFVPAIPTALAMLLGTGIARATLRMRHRALICALLSIAALCLVMAGSGALGMAAERGILTERAMLLLLGRFSDLLAGVFPPADWVAGAVQGRVPSWLWLVLGALAALALLTALAARAFVRISDGLCAGGARGTAGRADYRPATPLRALWRKEWMRYTSCSIYMMNTSVGWLMYLLAAAAVCTIDVQPYLALLRAVPAIGEQVLSLLPLAPALMAGMSSVTACAISMEGRQMEQVRALPVRMRDWLGGKLLLHMTIAVPAIVLGGTAIALKLRLSLPQVALLIGYPLAGALLIGVAGLALNLRFPRLDWDQPVQAVKNGASVLVTMLLGLLLALAAGGLCLLTGRATLVLVVLLAVQLAAAAVLWGTLQRARMP